MSLYRKLRVTLIFTALLLIAGFMLPIIAQHASASPVWQPTADTPIHWQWQIGSDFNTSTDLIPNVTVYDIDAFSTDAGTVAYLHSQGYKVIAYISFGTWENWRSDASSFPSSVKGNGNGWPGEKWLDIRSSTVQTIMAARLDMIKAKGFDAVEPDNIDGYTNGTGFPLTAQNQLDYNEWIATECHNRGLSVGLKNDVDQASALQPYFDWALNEECYKYSECDALNVFVNANKAVFQVEYSGTSQCATMWSMHINSMRRDLNLVAPGNSGYIRTPCIPDDQDSWGTGPTSTPKTTPTPTAATVTFQTPVGTDVTVALTGAVATFSNVTIGGIITLTTQQSNPGGTLPSGFQVAGLYVDIATTANYTGPVTVGIAYNPSDVTTPQNLKLFHWQGGQWVDVTTSVDTEDHLVYGQVSTLSPFFIGDPSESSSGVMPFWQFVLIVVAAVAVSIIEYILRKRRLSRT